MIRMVWVGLLSGFLMMLAMPLSSQNYWVYFTDKDGVTFDPESWFDAATIRKMELRGISPMAEMNFPVREDYVEAVGRYADSIGYVSRWFDAVAVKATPEAIRMIAALPCVAWWEPSGTGEPMVYADTDTEDELSVLADSGKDLIEAQTDILGLRAWQACGMDGSGIRIAVFDGGFPSWNSHPAFEHLRQGERILKTWDFTRNRENVDRGISHGTSVLSCIAGVYNNRPLGLASGASFLLAITEVRTEPFSEEQNWLAAAEWAHKHGADIINSSLGYTNNRYFTDQMDGKTPFVTRAANKAAAQGMLVVNAAGNEGTGNWKIIGAPADADSVLSVGGIDPATYRHINFSSYGPTFDQRMKPNVVAFGTAMAAKKQGTKSVSGTSFASPLMAGFAACAWQTDTAMSNMELFRRIEESGHLYPYFDYAHGFGIPGPATFLPSECFQPEVTFVWSEEYEDDYGDDIPIHSFDVEMDEIAVDTVAAEPVMLSVEDADEMQLMMDSLRYLDSLAAAAAMNFNAESAMEMGEWYPSGRQQYDERRAVIYIGIDDEGYADIRVACKSGDIRFPTDKYLYLHLKNQQGVLTRYLVVEISDEKSSIALSDLVPLPLLQNYETLCIHFRGVTECEVRLGDEE